MPNTRKMTVRQALALYSALGSLDGWVEETTVTNPKTGEVTTTRKVTPFKLGKDGKGGQVRWDAALNRDLLEAVKGRFEKEQNRVILSVSGGAGVIARADPEHPEKPDPEYDAKMGAVNRELAEYLDAETEVVGLVSFRLSDLNLDANDRLAPSALAALKPLIADNTAEA